MASTETKTRIIAGAVACFNREGIAQTRLQQMADEIGMSLGNMTYHFRNKEAVMQAIWDQLADRQRVLLAEYRVLPLFEDLERLMRQLFELQQAYRFFYTDTLDIMRTYPGIRAAYRQHLQWQVLQVEGAIQFNQARGALRMAPVPGYEATLAQQFWLMADQWQYRQAVAGLPSDQYADYRIALWAVFIPFCTDMGLREYQQIPADGSFFSGIRVTRDDFV
ncbi:MAG: TetR/AcrR family transcriptional regulator [Bacteroidia bacterium]|nr:TetR/AcrR family transcriptional regulator [Bacteroidia bacterium]